MITKATLGLRFSAIVACLAISSCGPLISFGDEGPIASLYTLQYPHAMPITETEGPLVYVASPEMAGRLDSENIVVVLPDKEITSLEGAKWSDHLSDLLRDYITQSLAVQAPATLLGQSTLDVKADCRLGVKVWSMELAPGSTAQDDHVQVSIQLLLLRLADNRLIGQKLFNSSKELKNNGNTSVMEAFNDAMFDISNDYGVWFKEKLPACNSQR
ncbi:ABC-type transport auxiliary lipoprotein family protein [Kordiimonas pumila]|uniref:ABC-type transport auxiliary lipoprotein family protein n=1 Tax=Kordiimonas pumila TaxID=2161677 RepID=A0ABV7D1G4_9PROT|nr:ABC-type transport auxiliary lipoprotein family protein [Kordiimonas pumila]